MTVFLTKIRSLIKSAHHDFPDRLVRATWWPLLLMTVLGSLAATDAHARAPRKRPPPKPKPEYQFKIRYDSKIGMYAFGARELSMHRHGIELTQTYDNRAGWSFQGGIRATAESAYAANPDRFSHEVVSGDSSEILLRDLYIQYKNGPWLVKAGNQQVVWGEAFGFYFADIVNPKDLREFGLGDLSAQRIPIPILNVRYILKGGALQTVIVPRPSWNRLPTRGSDFHPGLPSAPIAIAEDRPPAFAMDHAELGLRGSKMFGSVDLSVFYFNYLDRMPNYTLSFTGGGVPEPTLEPIHHRIQTTGMTATADLSTFLLRFEGIFTPKRHFDYLTPAGYLTEERNELTYVLGLDYTGLSPWVTGMQVSKIIRSQAGSLPGAITPEDQALISLHFSGSPVRDHQLDGNFNYMLSDKGILAQLKYKVPLSRRFEVGVGGDFFLGDAISQFGTYRRASRVYLSLGAHLGD